MSRRLHGLPKPRRRPLLENIARRLYHADDAGVGTSDTKGAPFPPDRVA